MWDGCKRIEGDADGLDKLSGAHSYRSRWTHGDDNDDCMIISSMMIACIHAASISVGVLCIFRFLNTKNAQNPS